MHHRVNIINPILIAPLSTIGLLFYPVESVLQNIVLVDVFLHKPEHIEVDALESQGDYEL